MSEEAHDRHPTQSFDLRSDDIAAGKRAELLRLFSEARTEGGQIDYDQLRRGWRSSRAKKSAEQVVAGDRRGTSPIVCDNPDE